MMKKHLYLSVCGISIALAGLVVALGSHTRFDIVIPALFIFGGLLAFLFARSNSHHKIAYPYHTIQSIGLVVFGLLIGLVPQNPTDLLDLLAYYMLLFGLIEIIYVFSAFTTQLKLHMVMLTLRVVTGVFGIVGGIVIMRFVFSENEQAPLLAGSFLVILGLSFVVMPYFFDNKSK